MSNDEQSRFPMSWEPAPLDWQECEHNSSLECAALNVPTNWDDLDSTPITLRLARVPARGTRSGSIIVNPGGPGASGLEYLSPHTLSSHVMDQFDVVSWDPRGVGRSTSLDCSPDLGEFFTHDPDPDSPDEQMELENAAQAIAADCSRETSDDTALIEFIRTSDTVMDLEAIRQSLGGDALNFIGYSYGSHIGLRYLERFPSVVRTLVVDGVVDPAEPFATFLANQASSFEQTFAAQDVECRHAGPSTCGVNGLGHAFDQVHQQTETGLVEYNGQPLGPSDPIMAAVMSGYFEDGWEALGSALAGAVDNDWGELQLLAVMYYTGVDYAAYLGVVCTDSPRPTTAEEFVEFADRLSEQSPRFGATVANELLPCAWWDAPPGPEPVAIDFPNDIPVLFVGTINDPATPYAVAQRLAAQAPQGQLITAHRFGHVSYGRDDCVTQHVDEYLLTRSLPSTDPQCGQ